jgi:hypothetical protein
MKVKLFNKPVGEDPPKIPSYKERTKLWQVI